jgi:hypothetical protein
MRVGFYVPLYTSAWKWPGTQADPTMQSAAASGRQNAIFLGPVAEAGVITTTSPPTGTASTTTSSTGTTSTAGSTTTTPASAVVTAGGPFKYWAGGFGLGHEELRQTPDGSAEVISYARAMWGKWETFGDEWRLAIEGRLVIPGTAFQIGFDANMPARRHPTSQPGDLRFFLGMRFDVGQLIGRLKVLGS